MSMPNRIRHNAPGALRSSSVASAMDFYRQASTDLFAKCQALDQFLQTETSQPLMGTLYRVMLESGLDHHIRVRDPTTRRGREMLCFDSNSYLGLHLHPRVLVATRRALNDVGYGTPSAQLLCGTNRYLGELEQTLAAYHGREDAIVFPSGYAANLGTITALVRGNDWVICDQLSHASIHDGCQATRSRHKRIYAHDNMTDLERILIEANADRSAANASKLIVTDGIFSMHGVVARLPELVALARRYNARLMVDDAHGTGIYGPTGRGTEEHCGVRNGIDVLMGTFSKAPGTIGGYVCADHAVVNYLRFYARAGFFTASLPAALCAGITEAFRIMQEEPQHRERLWENVHRFKHYLAQLGIATMAEPGPIMTVFVGTTEHLWAVGRELFERGIKCGIVDYPAVSQGEALLRFTLNARHTESDLQQTADALHRILRRHGLLRSASSGVSARKNDTRGGGDV